MQCTIQQSSEKLRPFVCKESYMLWLVSLCSPHETRLGPTFFRLKTNFIVMVQRKLYAIARSLRSSRVRAGALCIFAQCTAINRILTDMILIIRCLIRLESLYNNSIWALYGMRSLVLSAGTNFADNYVRRQFVFHSVASTTSWTFSLKIQMVLVRHSDPSRLVERSPIF